jgi:Protein phosphatase 2C
MAKTEPISWLRSKLKKMGMSRAAQPADVRFPIENTAPVVADWRVIGKSVRGASHLRSGLPNQDAIGWEPEAGRGSAIVLAVSDGHGSAKYFRSDRGAAFAVQAALAECGNLLSGHPDFSNLSAIKRTAEDKLPQAIYRHWQRLVQEDSEKNPATAEELDEAILRSASPVDRSVLESHPMTWYGATVLAAIVTNAFAIYLGLGDGEILTVFGENEVTKPFPAMPKEETIGDDTRSLCLPNAWRDFTFTFQALTGIGPALILVTTDGYPKSYADDAGFVKVGADIFELIRNEGLEAVDASLESWLNEASTNGSGDDITVGLLYCGPGVPLVERSAVAPDDP